MHNSKDHADILTVLDAEWTAFFARDFDGFARHWHHSPNTRRMISGPHTRTRTFWGWDTIAPRVKEGMRKFPEAVVASDVMRWENLSVNLGTDMAWVIYDQVAYRRISGLQASPFQHELKILQKIDGAWKLVCLSIIVPGIQRTDTPQVELGVDGRVEWVNDIARERLKGHPGLTISRDRLRARNRRFDPGLQAHIARAVERLDYTNAPEVLVRRPSDYVLLGENENGQGLYCWLTVEQERVVVSFDDEYLLADRLDLAAKIFALSPAQRDLAERLAGGTELAAAAETLGVSLNTLRTQLRRMFDKTGTHTQAGLLTTLLRVQQPK